MEPEVDAINVRAARVAALAAEVKLLEHEVQGAEKKKFIVGERQWNRMAKGSGRQCIATNRSGERCGKEPIIGGFVCHMHGGGLPHVKRAAQERLQELLDPALDALNRYLRMEAPCEHCGRTDADRDPVVLRAVQMVLDRTGHHPSLTVQVEPPRNPFEGLGEDELIERLETLLAAARQNRALKRAHLVPRLLPVRSDSQCFPSGNGTPPEEYSQ